MEKKLSYINKIQNLLNLKGIADRKQASTIATILGLQYNSAKQKLDGKRGITFDELKKIYQHFNEPFDGQRAYNGILAIGSIHQRCNVEIDDELVSVAVENETYAEKKNGLFIISTSAPEKLKFPVFKINKIEFLPPPKIAILDNNQDILAMLQKISSRYGIEADAFQTQEDIIKAVDSKNYEAYILDWLLDFNDTAENIVHRIREKAAEHATIIILTGQLSHYEKNISEMILKHDIHLVEKPAKPLIISSILLSHLFFC